MPYPKEHKQRSRLRILGSAYRLFSRRGFEAVAIDDIMADAGMTRGAFYAHFSSKSELYQQALIHAIVHSPIAQSKPPRLSAKSWLKELLRGYLHTDHIRQSGSPCPLAFLATDVAVREPQVRKAYTDSFKGMNRIIAEHAKSFSSCSDRRILAITAMMIGGVAIARALDDSLLTEDLLKSCRTEAERLLDGG
jgi:AcrR family transcriptional regulator